MFFYFLILGGDGKYGIHSIHLAHENEEEIKQCRIRGQLLRERTRMMHEFRYQVTKVCIQTATQLNSLHYGWHNYFNFKLYIKLVHNIAYCVHFLFCNVLMFVCMMLIPDSSWKPQTWRNWKKSEKEKVRIFETVESSGLEHSRNGRGHSKCVLKQWQAFSRLCNVWRTNWYSTSFLSNLLIIVNCPDRNWYFIILIMFCIGH